LSAALGLITLGHKSLWYDEAFDAQRVRESWHSLFHVIGQTEMSQAAYLVVLKPWVALTSSSEVWLRMPSVIFAALAAALLVPLGARLLDRATGIVAGVLLATNQFVLSHAQEARTYALVTLAVVVASYLFVMALDDPSRQRWITYAVVAALSVYCHFYAGFVIVGHLAILPFVPSRPPLRRVVEAAAVFLVLVVPALFFTATADRTQVGWIPAPSLAVLHHVTDAIAGGNPAFGLAAVLGLAILLHRLATAPAAARWRPALIGIWAALPLVLGALVSVVQPILWPQYAIVTTPALALAAAAFVSTLYRSRRTGAAIAIVVIVGFSGYRIAHWYRSAPEDWRGATAYVSRERHPGDAVLVAPPWAIDAFRYYDQTTPLASELSTGRTFVLVFGSFDDPAEVVTDSFGRTQLRLAREVSFGRRLVVRLLEPPP
jgi:mannosyltransferase